MPVAIVVLPDKIPGIFSERNTVDLVGTLSGLSGAPEMNSKEDAVAWLQSLALPSGWFSSADEAKAFADQCLQSHPMSTEELEDIVKASGLSRAKFGLVIGFGGNDNTRHKQISEMIRGSKPIMPEKAQRARALAVA